MINEDILNNNSYELKIPIFNVKVIVIIYDELIYHIDDNVDLSNYDAITYLDKSTSKIYLSLNTKSYDNSILVHEIVHIVNYIFQLCNIELDKYNDETQAYLSSYLFKLIDKLIKENYEIK